MLKILILLTVLVCSSLFLTKAYSLDVEIQPESDRIVESMGWLEPKKIAYQEHLQILIDYTESRNRITVGLLSPSPNDIRFPDYIENIVTDTRISSFIITNQFACAPTQVDRACVIVEIKKEGLGDSIGEIKNNARELADNVVGDGVILYMPEFHSVTLAPKTTNSGEKTFVAKVLYTINKQKTHDLFMALSSTLLSSDIRNSNGFYNYAEAISRNQFSSFTISLSPEGDRLLRSMQISIVCSSEIINYVDCPENITEQLTRGYISPIDFIEIETITRTELFQDQFLPLNSIIEVIIFSENDLQVTSVNNNLIEKLENLGDVQENGWFFVSDSGKKIDGRYIFGQDHSVNKNDLAFSIGDDTDSPIDVVEVSNDGGCLIATATFGSEMAPQVQFLREIRDNTVLQTESGSAFMTGFNQFYYSFSPVVADYERENTAFKETVKITLVPLLISLTLLEYADIDSESEMLGYGIGVILLNIGIYFVAPAVLIMKIKKLV